MKLQRMTDDDVAATLLELGAATLSESGGAAMRPRICAVWPRARLAALRAPGRVHAGRQPRDPCCRCRSRDQGARSSFRWVNNASSAIGERCSPPWHRRAASSAWSSTAECATWMRWNDWRFPSSASVLPYEGRRSHRPVQLVDPLPSETSTCVPVIGSSVIATALRSLPVIE